MDRISIVAVAIVTGLSGPAFAQEIDNYVLLGHDVVIDYASDGFTRRLVVDDDVLLEDAYIDISEVTIIEGIPIAVGESSGGGNVCATHPFLLSIPVPGQPEIHGPLETCGIVKYAIEDNAVTFIETVVPGTRAPAWRWTLAGGLEAIDLPIAAPSGGWNDLDLDEGFPPYKLLANAAAVNALDAALGEDMVQYREFMGEAGLVANTKMVGDFLLVDTGNKYAAQQRTRVYIDPTGGRAFVFMYIDGEQTFGPDISEWPKILLDDLDQ